MKPTRTIEKLAYGENTPDEMADMVPTWDELDLPRSYRGWDSMGIHGSGLSIRDTRDGRWYMTAPDALSARWFAACLIAHAAGCPPHWADMGFRTNCSGWWHHTDECDLVDVSYPGFTGDDWYVTIHEKSRKFTTELETRMHAYQLLEDGKR